MTPASFLRDAGQEPVDARDVEQSADVPIRICYPQDATRRTQGVEGTDQLANARRINLAKIRQIEQHPPFPTADERSERLTQLAAHRRAEGSRHSNGREADAEIRQTNHRQLQGHTRLH